MLPNLVVVGAMKCGTTSLHHYLGLHPRIVMAPGGLNFFIEERNWSKGAKWYESQFQGDADIYGDTSPRYSNYPIHQHVSERMEALIPNAKLIYLVRDPIARLVAHYRHAVASGDERRPFAEAMHDLDACPYVVRGLYATQLEQFLRFYPMSSIHVVDQEDLRDRRLPTLRGIFRFLGVDDSFVSPRFAEEQHRTDDKSLPSDLGGGPVPVPQVPPQLRQELCRVFRPEIARFVELTQRSWSWGC